MNYYKVIKYEVGQVVYLVPRDRRDEPFHAEIVKTGRKYAYAKRIYGDNRLSGNEIKLRIGENRTHEDYGSGSEVYESQSKHEQSIKDERLQRTISKELGSYIMETDKLEAIAKLLGIEREEQ